jgi:xanthine dehydrogenase iron-sulfur cluster and FAD-binding subunit A
MRVRLEPSSTPGGAPAVREVALAFGGLDRIPRRATAAEKVLLDGGVWSQDAIARASGRASADGTAAPAATHAAGRTGLMADFELKRNETPGGQSEFRQTLAASFLLKFYIATAPAAGVKLTPELKSAAEPYRRPLSSGAQEYPINKNKHRVCRRHPGAIGF